MSPAKARLFVALDLPPCPRAALVRWTRQELSAQPGMRLVAAESLHVTLCFLGWREEAEVDRLGELVAACATPAAPRLCIGEPVWLPPRRPRVLALDLTDPDASAAALRARVSETLAANAQYEPETCPFRAHVTVARVGREPGRLAIAPQPPPALRFDSEALTLYRSRLGADGARYEPVLRRAFGPASLYSGRALGPAATP